MRKRDIRRYHRQRIIDRYYRIFTKYYGWYLEGDPWLSAKLNAGKGSIGCGCWMCANPRKTGIDGSPLTIQEQIAEINEKEYIEEL
jgi:hypothetical protein